MVLADDNFATIVSAVEEGRAIYNNMQAFIRYLISSNIGEVAAIFLTATIGFPEGLIPVQLLWVNLVTDGPPATALGFNPADPDIMEKPPRKTDDDLITPWVFFRYMVVGLYVGWACVASFGHWYVYDGPAVYGDTIAPTYSNGIMMNGGGRTTWSDLMSHGDCSTKDEGNAHYHLKAWAENIKNPSELQEYFGPKFDNNALEKLQADPCMYYDFPSKTKASTISLSVLVTIEMLNALNALSEDGSLLQTPPWANPYLILAMIMSFAMHFVILEIDGMDAMFSVCHLTAHEWWVVIAYSMPVIFIDEILKAVGRNMQAKLLAQRRKEMKMD
jgi:Ca2+-transporting ATPase